MDIAHLLRRLPVLAHELPSFDSDSAPAAPVELFIAWLHEAVAAGVAEPHAMVVSTVDGVGTPDARVLLLRDVDDRGWHFATSSSSAKGHQLARHPEAALTFYWREQGRQVRVRGIVKPLDNEACAREFLGRTEQSRAAALAGRQSEVLADPADLDVALTDARRRLADDPQIVAPDHTLYAVAPSSVEFWQNDPQRRHVRLRYRQTGSGWISERLWP
jgi:pyridoxamine 5'-phosphate oxidase